MLNMLDDVIKPSYELLTEDGNSDNFEPEPSQREMYDDLFCSNGNKIVSGML